MFITNTFLNNNKVHTGMRLILFSIISTFLLLTTAFAVTDIQREAIEKEFVSAQENLVGQTLPPTFQKILKDETVTLFVTDETEQGMIYSSVIKNGKVESITSGEAADTGIIITLPKDVAYAIVTSENKGKTFFEEYDAGKLTVKYNVGRLKALKYRVLVYLAKSFV